MSSKQKFFRGDFKVSGFRSRSICLGSERFELLYETQRSFRSAANKVHAGVDSATACGTARGLTERFISYVEG
ncbi:hypothetical protein AK812_SmicGene26207 [Symbiodinium microadriaticum]|uniref:Uncharacterized protein n=1 Tax=Symbiodinium microadriaticum TaxID=2951 RepID=A0A1Q9DA85_SYMMI|nr:hypothetical protein AK812_SmicGene26207 [Symbiodinium microadriaticum]